ncbi:hypothetical protein DICPUDRAFT_18752, partial [Dictyostelium purpureum]
MITNNILKRSLYNGIRFNNTRNCLNINKLSTTAILTTSAKSNLNNLSFRNYSTENNNINNNTNSNNIDNFDIKNYIVDPNKINSAASNNNILEPTKLPTDNIDTITINLDKFKINDPELIPITGIPTFIEVCLNKLHQFSHLPWLIIVPTFTVALRLALFPISIKSRVNSARLLEIKPQLDKFKEQQKLLRQKGAPLSERAEVSDKITTILREKGCHPIYSFLLPLSNLPFLVSSVFAFRDMAENYPSLKDAGMLWFPDLASSDPLFILPTICSALYLLATELAFANSQSFLINLVKWVSRIMSVSLILFSPSIPAICYLYWVPSAIFTIAQIQLFNSNKFLKLLGLPQNINSQSTNILNIFSNKVNKDIKYAPELPN